MLSQPILTEENTMNAPATADTTRYLAPGWADRNIANRLIRRFSRMGIAIRGSHELLVRGRTSGKEQSLPVNPLTFDGARYLVAPRGETEWVRNLRAAGEGRLRLGRKIVAFSATEVVDGPKAAVLQAYLTRWSLEVGSYFDGVNADSDLADFERVAHNHPVFAIVDAPSTT